MRRPPLNPVRAIARAVDGVVERRLAKTERRLEQFLAQERERLESTVTARLEKLERRLDKTESRVVKTSKAERDHQKRTLLAWHRSVLRRVAKVEEALDRREGSRDDAFYAVAALVVEDGRTMLAYGGLYTLWQAARNAAMVDGAWAEVGVYRGGTAAFLLEAARTVGAGDVEFHGFDLFDSPPPADLPEEKRASLEVEASAMTLEGVQAHLERFPRVTLHRGAVTSDSLAGLPERVWALVHVDVNFLEPTLESLRYFAPRLVPGGVLVLDDYRESSVPDVAVAFDKWLAEANGRWQRWESPASQLVLVRLG